MSNKFKDYVFESKSSDVKVEPLAYGVDDLDPVMTQENVEYHYNVHTKGYAKKQKDSDFQMNGLLLHNLWWSVIRPPRRNNVPKGEIKTLIEEKFGSFQKFKDQWELEALGIEGSGWLALTPQGRIVQIRNHSRVSNFVLILDMWEHAFYPTYGPDKKAYVQAMWSVYNWEKVNDLLTDN